MSRGFSSIQVGAPQSSEWSREATAANGRSVARCPVLDNLEPTSAPRWYVVRNIHRTVIEARPLASDVDLKRALVIAMLAHIDAGWQIGEFSSRTGHFFCTKGDEQRMIEISPQRSRAMAARLNYIYQIEHANPGVAFSSKNKGAPGPFLIDRQKGSHP
jgi:hypothetical protein